MTMIRRTTALIALALAVLPSLGASASQDRTLAPAPAAGTIATYTGGGVGDGRPATKGLLVAPTAIAFDAAGDLYIADAAERRVRVVRKGIMTTLAGTGDLGTGGDGGPATAARLEDPAGVAVDGAGNVYVSDNVVGASGTGGTAHTSVRRIDAHGVISTLAGSFGGSAGGLAVTRDGKTVYVATGNEVVAVSTADGSTTVYAGVDAPGQTSGGMGMATTGTEADGTTVSAGDGGPATRAFLSGPTGVALDGAGNLYIADTGDCRVREVSASSQTITTALGADCVNVDVLDRPVGVAVDGHGRIYVSDLDNSDKARVLLVTNPGSPGSDTVMSTPPSATAPPLAIGPSYWGGVYAVGGDLPYPPAASAFVYPVYAADVTIAGQRGRAGDGAATGDPATGVYLDSPSNVVASGGQVYVTDAAQAMRIDPSGTAYAVAGTGALPPPRGADGVSDTAWYKTYGNPEGRAARAWALEPAAVAVDPNGGVYVADLYTWRVLRIDSHGVLRDVAGTGSLGLSSNDGPALSFGLDTPDALLWANGALYVTDSGVNGGGDGLIIRIGSDGMATIVAGGGESPNAVVSGGGCNTGSAVNPELAAGLQRNSVPARQACLQKPSGLAMDAAGNLYFAESGLSVVDKVTPSGTLTIVAGVPDDDGGALGSSVSGYAADGTPATSAVLRNPQGVAVDGAGNLYIADTGNAVIRKVDGSGMITTVVGGVSNTTHANGYLGVTLNSTSPMDRGDGGPASAAYLQAPVAVAVDPQGNLYIADASDGRVRVVGGIASAHTARDASAGAAAHRGRLNRAW